MVDKLTGIAYLLVILSVLVIAHEYGHFIVARLFKTRVDEFSLFFGKKLWTIGKRGDTEYIVRSVPLGGFVRIAGMEADDISGGRPIIEAIRNGPNERKQGNEMVAYLADRHNLKVDFEKINQDTLELIDSAYDSDGMLTPAGREVLEREQASPNRYIDEKRIMQVLLLEDTRAKDPNLYNQKPIYQRALMIFGGPAASIIFGLIILCILGMTLGMPSGTSTNQLAGVLPGKPAHKAGLLTGDRIIEIDGKPINSGNQMVKTINASAGKSLQLVVDRSGQHLNFNVTPDPEKAKVRKNGRIVTETVGRIGVWPHSVMERMGPVASITRGCEDYFFNAKVLLSVLLSRDVLDNVGGPVAMVQTTSQQQRLGLANLVHMAAMFSLSLGIFNLVPIPILDGGHLMLLLVEKLRRRKLSAREVYRAQLTGLAMLALIVLIVMYKDISRLVLGTGIQ